MPSLARLTTLFSAIAVAGCGATDPPSISRDSLTTNVCVNQQYTPLTGLTPKVAVDYLELRGNGGGGISSTSTGTACATATDAAKCKTALAGIMSTSALRSGQAGGVFIVYTRGDEVGAVSDAGQLQAFLSFSSVNDAAAIAWAKGHNVLCMENNAGTTSSGFVLLTRTGSGCGGGDNVDEHRVSVTKTGDFSILDTVRIKDGDPGCQIGRRPEGLGPCVRGRENDLGEWFAQIARLEAASVIAFERLAVELRALGAPDELVAIARASAVDEVRHARMTATLARRFGGVVEPPSVAPVAPRTLFEVARENAVEGCVRETFGALVATYQQDRAMDADIRAAMRIIARDETRHSALAWEIAAWAEPLLTDEQRDQVTRARRDAARDLRIELHAEPLHDAQRLAGVPAARDAVAMFDAAATELWAA